MENRLATLVVSLACGPASAITVQEVLPDCAAAVEAITTGKSAEDAAGVMHCLGTMNGAVHGAKVMARRNGIKLCMPEYTIGQHVAEWLAAMKGAPSLWKYEAGEGMAQYVYKISKCE